jgi:hypothetical protein
MIQQLLLLPWLIILKIPDLLIAGNASKLMASCATMILMLVKSPQLDHPTEPMESAANQVSPENIVIVMEPTLAVNQLVVPVMDMEIFLLRERIIKCLLIAQVLEIKKPAE